MPSTSNHASTPFRRIARIAAIIVWCGLIFAASARPDLRVAHDDLLDFVLRKTAHMLVFGVLAVLVWHALRAERVSPGRALAAAWLATFAYAVSDEWHQTFVHGRVGHAQDVGIDMIGASIALALTRRFVP
jgi:VanZ family protein